MKKAHKLLQTLTTLSMSTIIVALVVSSGVSVLLLRRNNLRMVELRTKVVEADANGGDVQAALKDLRAYVTTHMNTNLRSKSEFAGSEPPIQLVNTYNKAVADAQAKAAAANGNTSLYNEAEANCKQRAVPLTVIASCIQEYVAARTNNQNPAVAAEVPKELYTYDFVSPKWSPDLAGWSVVVSLGLTLMLLGRIIKLLLDSYLLKADL